MVYMVYLYLLIHLVGVLLCIRISRLCSIIHSVWYISPHFIDNSSVIFKHLLFWLSVMVIRCERKTDDEARRWARLDYYMKLCVHPFLTRRRHHVRARWPVDTKTGPQTGAIQQSSNFVPFFLPSFTRASDGTMNRARCHTETNLPGICKALLARRILESVLGIMAPAGTIRPQSVVKTWASALGRHNKLLDD